jgi:metal-sulfur cluster biosynthetic enzyme
MDKYLYSQHDEKADFYNHPQISEMEPVAFSKTIERSIKLCRDPKILANISDCKLVYLGTFDDETGKFNILPEPKIILECDKLIESLNSISDGKN